MPESPTPWPEGVREAVERLRETATSAGMSAGEVQALLDEALRVDPQEDATTLRVRPGGDVAPTIASPTAAPDPEPSIGRDLGRYRVLHELGHGGMGVVYRAHDKTLGRDVALKVLSVGDRPDRELLDRFQREARAAAAMDHPHIVKVLDVGELPSERAGEPGKPFYTMELLSGEDLAHAIGGGSITPRDAVEVTRQVALALAYAHGRGVLHRDVKPQNIFLRAEAHPPPPTADAPTVHANAATAKTLHAMLVDFGLAKFIEREYAGGEDARRAERLASLTQSGQVLGTPVYMAPEQVKGSRDVDARADVYALGATLYHMLTGQPPITGNSLGELLQAVQTVDPVSPRKRNARIDRDVETLCLKCLAKEPVRRYVSAMDLAEDCRLWLLGMPILARPVSTPGRIWRHARRNPAMSLLFTALLMTATALGLLQWRASAAERQVQARDKFAKLQSRVEQWARLKMLQLAMVEDLDSEPTSGTLAGCPGSRWEFSWSYKSLKISEPDGTEEEHGQFVEIRLQVDIPGALRRSTFEGFRPTSFSESAARVRHVVDGTDFDRIEATEPVVEAPDAPSAMPVGQERETRPITSMLYFAFAGLLALVFTIGVALPIVRSLRRRRLC